VYTGVGSNGLSLNAHPVGTVLLVPELASVLKSCVYGVPAAVRLTCADAGVAREIASTAKALETARRTHTFPRGVSMAGPRCVSVMRLACFLHQANDDVVTLR
jgi:hypothetical protein